MKKLSTIWRSVFNAGGILTLTDGPIASDNVPNGSLIVLDNLTVTCDNSANLAAVRLQIYVTSTGPTGGNIDATTKVLWASDITVAASSNETVDKEFSTGLVGWLGVGAMTVGVGTYSGLGSSGAATAGLTIEVLVDGTPSIGEFICALYHYESPAGRRE